MPRAVGVRSRFSLFLLLVESISKLGDDVGILGMSEG